MRYFMSNTQAFLQSEFLDWVNNYLTVDVFAEHRGISTNEARALIELGRSVHEAYVSFVRELEVA
jgi:hypothetical protein